MPVYWYYLKQQREQVQLVPDQVEIRFLNSFSDVVCLKLLGREFHTLGPVYLIDCFPKEMVLYGGNIREWFLLRLYSDSLSVKRELT